MNTIIYILVWVGLCGSIIAPLILVSYLVDTLMERYTREELKKNSAQHEVISVPDLERPLSILGDRVEHKFMHHEIPLDDHVKHYVEGIVWVDGAQVWTRSRSDRQYEKALHSLKNIFYKDMIIYGVTHMKMMIDESRRSKNA